MDILKRPQVFIPAALVLLLAVYLFSVFAPKPVEFQVPDSKVALQPWEHAIPYPGHLPDDRLFRDGDTEETIYSIEVQTGTLYLSPHNNGGCQLKSSDSTILGWFVPCNTLEKLKEILNDYANDRPEVRAFVRQLIEAIDKLPPAPPLAPG